VVPPPADRAGAVTNPPNPRLGLQKGNVTRTNVAKECCKKIAKTKRIKAYISNGKETKKRSLKNIVSVYL
jgi:hypothetical protein